MASRVLSCSPRLLRGPVVTLLLVRVKPSLLDRLSVPSSHHWHAHPLASFIILHAPSQTAIALLGVAGLVAAVLEDVGCFMTCTDVVADDGSTSCEQLWILPPNCTPARSYVLKGAVTLTTLIILALEFKYWRNIALQVHFALADHIELLFRRFQSTR